MADDYLALADLLQINDQNLADLNVNDLLDDAPLLAALAAGPASNGTQHKYLKETGAPVVGFRAANAGRDMDSSIDTLVTINLQILDASFIIDKAIADGTTRGPEFIIGREARRHMRAAFFGAESQLINGVLTGGDAGGFVGLRDATTLDGLGDAMVLNAAGNSARSSVFLIRTNDLGNDCTIIAGNDGKINMSDTVVQMVEETGSQKKFPAYATPITGWLGLQIGSAFSVARICNIEEDTNKLTDDMIYQALALFPASRQPNLIVMNRRSLEQLRDSRTATNVTGAPCARPTEVEGIQIIVTDAILNSEAAVT